MPADPSMVCQECKMTVKPANAYHPWLHCMIYKATYRDPAVVLAEYGYVRETTAVTS